MPPLGSEDRGSQTGGQAMTTAEKSQISSLRLSGRSYKEIAVLLAMKESTVKSYCFRNHLSDKNIASLTAGSKSHCLQCGTHIEQQEKRKPRRFCSDACRTKWWNAHRQLKHHKSPHTVKCLGCGKTFVLYGSQNRKYCSHECYVAARFKAGDQA